MPPDPDDDRRHLPVSRATLIAGLADGVAFLDAPGVAVSELIDAIDHALASRPAGSVLTVYSDDPTCRPAIDQLCRRHDLALLATISHDGRGTTFTLRHGRDGPDIPLG